MEKSLNILQDDEVISSINPKITKEINLPETAKVSELISVVFMSSWPDKFSGIVQNNFSCEVLQYGHSRWQKGQLKLCLAFIPDEEVENKCREYQGQSSLDAIRELSS